MLSAKAGSSSSSAAQLPGRSDCPPSTTPLPAQKQRNSSGLTAQIQTNTSSIPAADWLNHRRAIFASIGLEAVPPCTALAFVTAPGIVERGLLVRGLPYSLVCILTVAVAAASAQVLVGNSDSCLVPVVYSPEVSVGSAQLPGGTQTPASGLWTLGVGVAKAAGRVAQVAGCAEAAASSGCAKSLRALQLIHLPCSPHHAILRLRDLVKMKKVVLVNCICGW